MNRRIVFLFSALALQTLWVGCSPTVRKPRLYSPGPASYQQYQATQFDPYPPNDMAPPIVGGRPKDFQKPPDEVLRARQQRPVGPWRATPLTGPLY